jgi:hypothetical protein
LRQTIERERKRERESKKKEKREERDFTALFSFSTALCLDRLRDDRRGNATWRSSSLTGSMERERESVQRVTVRSL